MANPDSDWFTWRKPDVRRMVISRDQYRRHLAKFPHELEVNQFTLDMNERLGEIGHDNYDYYRYVGEPAAIFWFRHLSDAVEFKLTYG